MRETDHKFNFSKILIFALGILVVSLLAIYKLNEKPDSVDIDISEKWEFLLTLEDDSQVSDPTPEGILLFLRTLTPQPKEIPNPVTSSKEEIQFYLARRSDPDFPVSNSFAILTRKDGEFIQMLIKTHSEFYIEYRVPEASTYYFATTDNFEKIESTFLAFRRNDKTWKGELEWKAEEW